ncbi:MAG: TadE/TadG family type IV pilus assembly protein [Acidimicrobiia bacterium]
MQAGKGGLRGNRSGRRSGQRGAALVEFALIAPVLFLVLFGIIEFGMALNDYQSIRHGVRDGARQAVVQQFRDDTGCTSIDAPDDVKKVICMTKDRIGLGDDVRVQVEYDMTGAGSSGNYGSVSICAQRNVSPFTGAIPAIDGISLKSSIEMRLEDDLREDPSDADAIAEVEEHADFPVFSEPAPAGSDWSGC